MDKLSKKVFSVIFILLAIYLYSYHIKEYRIDDIVKIDFNNADKVEIQTKNERILVKNKEKIEELNTFLKKYRFKKVFGKSYSESSREDFKEYGYYFIDITKGTRLIHITINMRTAIYVTVYDKQLDSFIYRISNGEMDYEFLRKYYETLRNSGGHKV
ncbi:hypothetical protein [Clostridium ganghwense]|uniref:Uncharacterized protein n=1 Tax=Clostridium ganghwense TaxID=312089 RepID=A0ABT4CP13_9CLOT|nr:hypothetical protein [Clostridium ganghwense]MCY6370767.1 hypothetical protein [Clostridium ganghwense]